jgi:Flp pilus assembly protein TadD
MRQDPHSHHDGNDMIRAPNATEVSHLFALAEHEIIKGRNTEALILLRFIRSIDPEHTDAAARLALTLFRREQWNDAWDAFDIRFKLMAAQPSVKIRTPDATLAVPTHLPAAHVNF